MGYRYPEKITNDLYFMPYNIFTQQNLFQHNHDAYRDGSTVPDGVIVPEGASAATQPQQPAKLNVPGMDIAQRYTSQIMQKQNDGNWHGTNRTAPDGGAMDWIGRTYTYTTPEQEAKYRKQSRARMGILAVGDALRHLGNIYHTSKYAPSQQFNTPVEKEYALYQTQKAQRDKDNYAIATQRLKQAQWEADQAYKAATLGWRAKDYAIKERAADRADAKAKQDQENWKKNYEATQSWRDYQKERQTKMDDNTIRHQGVMEDISRQNLAVRWANLQETKAQHAWTRQNGGANGAGKQKVFFTGSHGSVSRSQGLSLDESVNMVNNLHKMGWVTDKKYNEFMSAIQGGNEGNMYALLYGGAPSGGKGATGGIIEGVLTYHKDGAKWLSDNYNFNITGPGTGVPAKVNRVVSRTTTPSTTKGSSTTTKATTTQKPASQPDAQQKAAAEKAAQQKAAQQKAAQQKAAQQKAAQQKAAAAKKGKKGKDGKPLEYDKDGKVVIHY